MTTNSDAYFARILMATLKEHHADFPVEEVKGRRIGPGSVRVIQMTHSGGQFAQFPFPPKSTHAGSVSRQLYRSACSMLRLTPRQESPAEAPALANTSTNVTSAQLAWLKQYEKLSGFAPIHQDALEAGDMPWAQVAQANIDWFEAWAADTFLAIQRNNPVDLQDYE